MNIFEYMLEKKILYLILGTIFSGASIGKYNFPLSIFIWPYCFLTYLHQNEKKLIPLIIISFCLIVGNLIRWFGYNRGDILSDMMFGIYYGTIILLNLYLFNIIIFSLY